MAIKKSNMTRVRESIRKTLSRENFQHLSTWSGLGIFCLVLVNIFLMVKPVTGIHELDLLLSLSAWSIGCYLIYYGVPELMSKHKERMKDMEDEDNDEDQ